MMSSVNLYCQETMIAMNSGSQLSELSTSSTLNQSLTQSVSEKVTYRALPPLQLWLGTVGTVGTVGR